MRFKTKPFEIEAVQFDGENFEEVLEFTGYRRPDTWDIPNFCPAGTYQRWDDPEITAEVYDKLHSSWVGVKDNQWIIRGQKGEYYPCDPEIFEAKYERVYTEEELWVTFEREDGSRVRVPRRPLDLGRETERGR